MNDVFDLWA